MLDTPHNRKDITITRGDGFTLWIGLARGWETVGAAPQNYQGRLVLRDRPDDAAPEVLAMISALEAGEDSRFPEMSHMLRFDATPAQTQVLPTYDLTCFCELRSLDGAYVRRLFDGKVTMAD